MPRVKVLKGVAHNVGSSFTSLVNYAADDYSMGHILRFARESGRDTLTIDLLNGTGSPDGLRPEAHSVCNAHGDLRSAPQATKPDSK
jgi:hypothetical protein